MVSGIPGTEMKVTPEMEVPIMPMATSHHGEDLPAKKKLLLSSDFPPEKRPISNNTAK